MDTPCRTRETFKDLRTASKVVCDVNSEYRRIQVNSVDFRVFLPYTFIIQGELSIKQYNATRFYHTNQKNSIFLPIFFKKFGL